MAFFSFFLPVSLLFSQILIWKSWKILCIARNCLNLLRISSVQSFGTPWTAAHRASLAITNYQTLLKFMYIESVMPSNHLILFCPFSSCLQSFPVQSFPMSQFFASAGQRIGVSASASVFPMNIQDWFSLGLTGCSPRDSQESSSAPQSESINSLASSLLYGPTLMSVHDYWKNYSFDYMNMI